MKRIRRMSVILLTLLVALVFVPAALAHPLGNFTINHYAGLNVARRAITIDYVLDIAEIPAFQEIATFDANGNGQPDASETAPYHPAKCRSLLPDLDLRVDGSSTALSLVSSSIAFPPGAGGLLTLRLSCTFSATLARSPSRISFADHAYAERLGWRE
ncbi:MAG TPA: hypothetical protein VIV15_17735, partial [Anaerolineales bacterium]